MVKRYEELTISDDFMFGKAMGDKVLCRDVFVSKISIRAESIAHSIYPIFLFHCL